MVNPYRLLGIVLVILGIILAVLYYWALYSLTEVGIIFIGSVPLAAVGLSTIILGLTCIFLANARLDIRTRTNSPQQETGTENKGIVTGTYIKILLSLAISFSLVDIVLALSGQYDIANYFVGNAIAYFVVTLLFVDFIPRANRSVNAINAIIFIGFLIVTAFKVVDILKSVT